MSINHNTNVIELPIDQYTIETDTFLYEIKPSRLTIKDVKNKEKFKRQNDTLKKLKVGEMFVVDKTSENASKWSRRWGKKLNSLFIVRKLGPNLTEVHRVQ